MTHDEICCRIAETLGDTKWEIKDPEATIIQLADLFFNIIDELNLKAK